MRVLMVGDVVGRPGRCILRDLLSRLKENYRIDFTIVNAENAAGGTGLTRKVAAELFEYGADILTMGNHIWDNKDIFNFIQQEKRILRPANYPPDCPGVGSGIFWAGDVPVGVINLSGRVFLPNLDCPFRAAEREVDLLRKTTSNIFVDFHAEATSEKVAMGWFLDGKVSAVFGTHTHVQTADERILPESTAYITDVGMTGPYNSVIGVKKELVIKKFITQMPVRFEVAGELMGQLNAVVVEIEPATGSAVKIQRILDYHEI
ncbi:MAG: TIGR00282 family metallophosphoesterase [Firmicutes bacterium HGW-Firmicutes-13]|nr:MAG: TIGR00282 family metallophosphoesterase [Firmicutes bacterium HGW-Firmicutes-13]